MNYKILLVTIISTIFCCYISANIAHESRENSSSMENYKRDECALQKSKRSLLLWSVESPRQKLKSFLFGTIHVSYDEVWDYVSHRVKEAFTEAETIVFELQLQNPETVELLLQCKNLENGETVRDQLPAHLYERLKQYMRRFKYKLLQRTYRNRQLSRVQAKREAKRLYLSIAGDWEMKRPVWLLFLLYQMSESSSFGVTVSADTDVSSSAVYTLPYDDAPMLDAYLARRAQELGKELGAIESPQEQCDPLHSVSENQIVFAINYTLAYLEWMEAKELSATNVNESSATRRGALAELIAHYRCGSLEASVFSARRFAQNAGFTLTAELDARARAVDELLVEDIIHQRNVRMASRADALIRHSPASSLFFAIGAGHFLGEKSLIKALEKYDYKISPVTEEEDIVGYFRRNNTSALRAAQTRFNALWVRSVYSNDGAEASARYRTAVGGNNRGNARMRSHPTRVEMIGERAARGNSPKLVAFLDAAPSRDLEITVSLMEMPHYDNAVGSDRKSGASHERIFELTVLLFGALLKIIFSFFFSNYLI